MSGGRACTRRRPGGAFGGLCAGLGLLPGAAFACALPPSVILTMPTGHYITAAGLTVALTALFGALAGRMPAMEAVPVLTRRVVVPPMLWHGLGFVGFLALLLVGVFGSRDPMHNLMTLVFWTGVWIVIPLGSMLFGDLWRAINPWTAPVRLIRLLIGRERGVGLGALGHWPAVVGYAGFVWFQMMSSSPDDPMVLAAVAGVYWLVILVLAVAEGEEWLDRGEFFTVLFGLIARVAPLWWEDAPGGRRLMRGWPGAQVARMAALSASQVVFVTLALAALSFDGLSQTFFWHGLIGDNPLEPAGRAEVALVNTVGFVGLWAVTLALCLGVIALGRRLGGAGFQTGPVMLSFLAIAAGYHAAHYLVMLLTVGQYTLAALNDPFFQGDSWLGLPPFYVSFGFLTDPGIMPLVYAAQFSAILGAHLLAVVLSLRVVGRAGTLAHLPLAVLMVGYTIFGLWLLSTARTG